VQVPLLATVQVQATELVLHLLSKFFPARMLRRLSSGCMAKMGTGKERGESSKRVQMRKQTIVSCKCEGHEAWRLCPLILR
jgi:hypothetical protein